MWKTFRIEDGTLKIATKVWSDFGATIPLTRSFSYGLNIPPQYPLFPGYPIRYHFVFFMIVGFLEKAGVPLDWALNTLSAIGFFFLLFMIYYFSKYVFKSSIVGVLSVTLFLFNGSLGFLEFFKKYPLSLKTLNDILTNDTFSSFGPYDGKIVSAFWNLNIFTNQRHLALAYASYLALLYFLYRANEKGLSNRRGYKNWLRKERNAIFMNLVSHFSSHPRTSHIPSQKQFPKQVSDGGQAHLSYTAAIVTGILIGFFPFVHLTVYMMMCITLLLTFFIFGNLRKQIVIMGILAGVIGIPQILLMGQSAREIDFFNPGYLISNGLTLKNFLTYWLYNLGLLFFLFPIGFFLARRRERLLAIPFITFFVIGNLFQFSPEIASNHKFFNLFVIGANMFVANSIYRLWKFHISTKILVPFLLIPLTLSGIIDFFPIVNDRFIVIDDIPKNPAAQFILANTPPDAVILNATFLYDPASLAGRKIYIGWPYFPWSAGYDTEGRGKTLRELLSPKDKTTLCRLVKQERIDYIETLRPTPLEIAIDYSFLESNLSKIYYDNSKEFILYDMKKSCIDVQ